MQLVSKDPNHKIRYGNIEVIITKMGKGEGGVRIYDYKASYHYYSQAYNNYLTVPFKQFDKGKYTLRVLATELPKEEETITIGLYSEAHFQLKAIDKVDDGEFIEKSLLSRAHRNPFKEVVSEEENIWRVIETIPESNLGYVMYHVGNKAKA